MVPSKYPRTPHLPWSKGKTNDDLYLTDISNLELLDDIIVTEKLDGMNTNCYSNHIHARSIDSKNHPSMNMMKNIFRQFNYLIPDNIKICGENVYPKHSIFYDKLTSYFYVYAIIDDNNICWGWDETIKFCESLNIATVPLLYRGKWNKNEIKKCYNGKSKFGEMQEGYVVRNSNSFLIKNFNKNVAKYVDKNFVIGNKHWTENWNNKNIDINELINKLENK